MIQVGNIVFFLFLYLPLFVVNEDFPLLLLSLKLLGHPLILSLARFGRCGWLVASLTVGRWRPGDVSLDRAPSLPSPPISKPRAPVRRPDGRRCWCHRARFGVRLSRREIASGIVMVTAHGSDCGTFWYQRVYRSVTLYGAFLNKPICWNQASTVKMNPKTSISSWVSTVF